MTAPAPTETKPLLRDPNAPIYTLRSVGTNDLDYIHFVRSVDPTVILVQFGYIDEGTGETGPSGNSCEEPMDIDEARETYRDAIASGYRPYGNRSSSDASDS